MSGVYGNSESTKDLKLWNIILLLLWDIAFRKKVLYLYNHKIG
jgi:hypothetical protein